MFPVTRGDLGNAVQKMLSGVGVYITTAMSRNASRTMAR